MLKQYQSLQQKQKLSPQQIQVIRMLELPVIELEERVKQELQDNPTLEVGPDDSSANDIDNFDESNSDNFTSSEELSLGDYRSEDDIPDYKLRSTNYEQQVRQPETTYTGSSSLIESLDEQISLRDLSEIQKEIAHYIIGNIDSNGYLSRSIKAIQDDIFINTGQDIPLYVFEEALSQVQELDPAGVGAESLQQCLSLQLERKKATPATNLAFLLVNEAFDDIGKRRYDAMMQQFDISEQELKDALHEITILNPKPGSLLDDPLESKKEQIIPDFIVEVEDGVIHLSLNNSNLPPLRISRSYQEMLEDYSNTVNQNASQKQAVMYMKQKIDAAQSFISAINTRNQTLQLTMQAIIDRQREFFLTGDERKLQPMILKDIATPTGFDISTISRVSNSKFVQTDYGIFPLKFFFTDGTQTSDGETITTREVKQLLAQIIEKEDKRKPLSDDKLCEQLTEKGYNIARRTVAKYREQLNIPVARLRKEL